MQLLVAIVQDEDADVLLDRLVEEGFRATRINTVGGFLVRGNVTILIGVEDDRVEKVIAAIRATCRTRRVFMNAMPPVAEPTHISMVTPLEVEIGGATVFSLPVKRFARLRGGETGSDSDEHFASHAIADLATSGGDAMNLILAIVQNDDVGAVTQALLNANYRVTRINTAGGFLRRGNASLLIGVEEKQVDDVLKIIKENTKRRTEASAPSAGMPSYSATVFVLESSRFVRV